MAELEEKFPDRKFTPDGHLVGSIGEVLAAERYGLTLEKSSNKGFDATTKDGRKVEIKTTQRNRIGMYSSCHGLHLMVIRITLDGCVQEIFNGPGCIAWKEAGQKQSNGQCNISISKLERLQKPIPKTKRIPLSKSRGSGGHG